MVSTETGGSCSEPGPEGRGANLTCQQRRSFHSSRCRCSLIEWRGEGSLVNQVLQPVKSRPVIQHQSRLMKAFQTQQQIKSVSNTYLLIKEKRSDRETGMQAPSF